MKILRLLAAIFVLAIPASAQLIDYRSLGPTYFGSNTVSGVKGIVTGMMGTNSIDGSITNRNQTYGKVSIAGTNAVITTDTGPHAVNWLHIGQTNGNPTAYIRSDGSVFYGKGNGPTGDLTDWGAVFFETITTVNSNEPPLQFLNWQVKGYESDGGFFDSYMAVNILAGKDSSRSRFELEAESTNSSRVFNIAADTSGSKLEYKSGGNTKFNMDDNGDLTKIKAVDYLWPATNGAAGKVLTSDGGAPQQLYWQTVSGGSTNVVIAGTNVTVVTNGSAYTVSVTDLTNTIQIVSSNSINQNARIGPGTNNWIAKFNVVGGTNVGNSSIFSDRTNLVEFRQRPDGGDFNSGFTNNIYGRETAGGDTNYLQIIAAAAGGSEAHHIRSRATGAASQRQGILINDAVNIEPITNQLVGHAVGGMYPDTGSTGAGLQTLGISTKPWLDVWASRMHGAAGLSSGPQFGSGVGGVGFGLTTDNTMLQFFRDTGITAAFNKERVMGTLQLDLAGNLLGFGSGISNTAAFLVYGGTVGYLQLGTNNTVGSSASNVVFAGAQGSGSNKGGSPTIIGSGRPTGIGDAPSLFLATSGPGTTGSSLQGLTNRVEISGTNGTVTIYSNLVVNGSITGGSISASSVSGSLSNSILELRDTPGAIYLSSYGTNKTTSFGTNVADMTTITNGTFSAVVGGRTFSHDATHTVITNTGTLTSSEWTAGTQKEWYNGATTITLDKTNGMLTAQQHQYPTNLTTMAPDFKLGYSLISTNAAFTLLAPINVDATRAETCVMMITNSTAAAVVITPPTPWKTQGVWYVTNLTSITVFHYGNAVTNGIALPIF
jgi:hypothetical protein